ncbi:MerR family transcriptional regulator [Vallitalea guaymasensis]|uniref:MerR family transcriptional regulator n=1 Tax=Vallitalea guaymasensis TaxID=1185412 RepID=A0A8J8MDS3_9FIRM|nr:MerR family transcriptional regulator [Vallitalea guaymasensis]QUH30800.1 MerR family transcriptional regulator [Vallitalea guaymasensis]
MRIGKFAEHNKVSKDTIRHYMDLDLIVPNKKSGQYYFDEKCQTSLEQILMLKNMEFSLNEIRNIFRMQLLGKYSDYQKNDYYQKLFIDKHNNIEKEIEHLINVKVSLEKEIQKLANENRQKPYKRGINIRFLDMFTCRSCKGNLTLNDGIINNNEIIQGKLKCKCGQEYSIDDGILIVDGNYDKDYSDNPYSISNYIINTDQHFIDNLYKGIELVRQKIDWHGFKDKVILEVGSGLGFILRNILNDLSDDVIYIAVDHNITMHRYLKKMLEKAKCDKNIIFICSDFLQIPIKNESVDILLDIAGTSNYGFNNKEYLLNSINHYIKKQASLIGAYILFQNFSNSSLINVEYRKNFIKDNIKKDIKSLGYEKKMEDYIYDYIETAGEYENYFTKGEKVYLYAFYGKR